MSSSDVLIVGGGVAGYTCACFLKKIRPDLRVSVLERGKDVLRRILVSGNGRCNFFNASLLDASFPSDPLFDVARKFFDNDLGEKAFSFFQKTFDIPWYANGDLYYPYSNRSDTVFSRMKQVGSDLGVETVFGDFLAVGKGRRISYRDQEGKTVFKNPRAVVFAMGGQSLDYPAFDVSKFKALGLCFHNFLPALCPLKTSASLKGLDGVRVKGTVTLKEDEKPVYAEAGEIIFRTDSVSGICVFNCSVRIRQGHDYLLSLDLTSHDGTKVRIDGDNLERALPLKLCSYLRSRSRNENRSIRSLSEDLVFPVTGRGSFKESQVSSGGLDPEELDKKTMECRKHPGVFFLGEMIDIPLPCGGFNIGSCIIEAFKAARAVSNLKTLE